MKWVVPVVHKYSVTSDAADHLQRSILCGIDFISLSGDATLLSMSDGAVEYVHPYNPANAQDTNTYDSLGKFIVVKHIYGNVIVYARYCHNGDVDVVAGQTVCCCEALGEYGNTGFSHGAHVHVDFWVSDSDMDDANKCGFDPKSMVVSPWPGSKLLHNVDATVALTKQNLDVKRG